MLHSAEPNCVKLETSPKSPIRPAAPARRLALKPICLLVFAALTTASVATAQVSASLSGTVTDPSRAAVSSATVTVRDVHTEVQRDTVTDAAGRYLVLALPVGEYEIAVKKQGFEEEVRRGVQLAVGQDASVGLQLSVGAVSQQMWWRRMRRL